MKKPSNVMLWNPVLSVLREELKKGRVPIISKAVGVPDKRLYGICKGLNYSVEVHLRLMKCFGLIVCKEIL